MIGIFSAVLFVALAILVAGMLNLFANAEVLSETDTGPLVAPMMYVVATAFLFITITRIGVREATRRPPVVLSAVIIGILAYFLFLLSGATIYSLGNGRPLLGILFFGSNAGGGDAIAVGVIAVVVAFFALLLFWVRDSGGAKEVPRWPWEQGDERDRRG